MVNETPTAVLKVAFGNSEQRNSSYIRSSKEGYSSIAPNIDIETYVPYRTAQLALINNTKIECTVFGQPGIKVGDIVNLNLPSQQNDNKSSSVILDKYYSGKYIVTAVRHIYALEEYQTMIEIAKESSQTQYQSVVNNTNWQQAITS